MADVKYEHVYKVYENGVTAVEDFNLAIPDGEFLILVGPSGCGKSTTLRMLAGLEEISRGDLMIGERRINDLPPRDRDIAMVFQNYALYPHFSVRDNMAFSLKLRKVHKTEIARKVAEVAEILGLTKYLERKPKELSGGQRQRVAMGRAIVRSPKVFLFDEPLSNLDAKLRVEMRVEIAKLHKKLQNTIVYVTHDQVEAMTLADRIVVMKDGRIQQVGTPMEIYNRPANSFVAGFIGTPPMNQVPVEFAPQDGKPALRGQQLTIFLDNQAAEQLEKHGNNKLLLGIRPEHLKIASAASSISDFRVPLEVIEPMGNESYLYFTLEQKQWIARHEGVPSFSEGEMTEITIDTDHIHLFSGDGSQRIL